MTELTIRPEEIRDAIERNVAAYSPGTAREHVRVARALERRLHDARAGLDETAQDRLLAHDASVAGVAHQRERDQDTLPAGCG